MEQIVLICKRLPNSRWQCVAHALAISYFIQYFVFGLSEASLHYLSKENGQGRPTYCFCYILYYIIKRFLNRFMGMHFPPPPSSVLRPPPSSVKHSLTHSRINTQLSVQTLTYILNSRQPPPPQSFPHTHSHSPHWVLEANWDKPLPYTHTNYYY
jgi:hypothetical protein